MQFTSGSRVEYLPAQDTRLAGTPGSRCKNHDIQLRDKSGDESRVSQDFPVKLLRCLPASLQSLRKLAALFQGQKLLCSPQCDCRRSRPRTLQADFTEMQFRRAEVGVRRLVFVQTSHA